MRGNLHRPYGFGRNGTVFGVAPPHNVEALTPRRSPKSGTVALRNLVTLSLAGTTRSFPDLMNDSVRVVLTVSLANLHEIKESLDSLAVLCESIMTPRRCRF